MYRLVFQPYLIEDLKYYNPDTFFLEFKEPEYPIEIELIQTSLKPKRAKIDITKIYFYEDKDYTPSLYVIFEFRCDLPLIVLDINDYDFNSFIKDNFSSILAKYVVFGLKNKHDFHSCEWTDWDNERIRWSDEKAKADPRWVPDPTAELELDDWDWWEGGLEQVDRQNNWNIREEKEAEYRDLYPEPR